LKFRRLMKAHSGVWVICGIGSNLMGGFNG